MISLKQRRYCIPDRALENVYTLLNQSGHDNETATCGSSSGSPLALDKDNDAEEQTLGDSSGDEEWTYLEPCKC